MSVPIREEKRSEAPLITFTLCVPASVGVAVLSALFELIRCLEGADGGLLRPSPLFMLACGGALLLATVGMLGSMLHLAKPIRAPFSLRHLRTSWLSREIAAVGLFWACLAAWLLGTLMPAGLWCVLGAVGLGGAALSGIALLFVIARAYKVPTRPAWAGSECLMELIASACGAGGALFLLFLSVCMAASAEEASSWASQQGALGFLVCIVLSWACSIAGAALGRRAHASRYRRLCSIRDASDERVDLTLRNHRKLEPVIRKAGSIEVAAVIAATIGTLICLSAFDLQQPAAAPIRIAIAFFAIAVVLEFIAHGMKRWFFYELPVPVRYVAFLRK